MNTHHGITLPYHPAYGLPDSVRLTILAYADTHGVPAAAKEFNVSMSSIYNWRRDADEHLRAR